MARKQMYMKHESGIDDIEISANVAKKIVIRGLVQGVGFRPFVYHLAGKHRLNGFVQNRNNGILIYIEGHNDHILRFLHDLKTTAPLPSHIHSMEITNDKVHKYASFSIINSKNTSGITNISPDIAVCETCLKEMNETGHRNEYPLINCTSCGPRFSIIRNLPYDRNVTSMANFQMCDVCESEYNNIHDRRYHAQPTACHHCGPEYSYHKGKNVIWNIKNIIQQAVIDIRAGHILAVKGLGGFNLMCDATNASAVLELRKTKRRDWKPFAVMFPDMQILRMYANVTATEEKQITSWRRPIVILNSTQNLPAEVSNGFHTVGSMLPSLPFHYLLFKHLKSPLICTSGNISNEPIIITNDLAKQTFQKNSDIGIVSHNRDIVNRTDDAVVKVAGHYPRIIRRARGYVPEPINAEKPMLELVGTGAELTGHFAISKENLVIPSQYIGDLQNAETLEFYEEAYERFCNMYRFKPVAVGHDLHPDYLSTRFARQLNVPALAIQHHHAHIASCLFENQRTEKTIGICFDGTGLGTDGNIWGSEFFVADTTSFEKLYSFDFVPLAGGDKPMMEPWRTALSYLMKLYGNESDVIHLPYLQRVNKSAKNLVLIALKKGLNTYNSCGMGRLFDAVAALTGICTHAGFHAEAPMRLENIVNPSVHDCYPLEIKGQFIHSNALFEKIMCDLQKGITPDVISTKFHNAIIQICQEVTQKIRSQTGIKHVALSGGVFQNAFLLEKLEEKLQSDEFEIIRHRQLPYNDGNIAVGQIAIANEMLNQ
jgi:hydrogenase maturation protein HypF